MSGDHQTLALLLFSAFVAVTLGITTWVGRDRHGSAEEFYTGGRLFSPMENGFAIAGDYMSAASFLGISGLIALFGYDGMLYSVGFLVAWLVVLLLVAELVRNCGRFTLADVVAARMRERPVRIAAGTSSVAVSVLYLVAQMVGAGSLVALLLGGTSEAARSWTVIGVGALMVVYVTLGGMRATTWIQIVKAVLLMAGTVALTVFVLLRFHGDFNALLTTAAERSGHGKEFLSPGLAYGGGWTARFDFISLGLALVLGTAGLPHILSRFYTVPTARAARRSVVWSIGLIGGFYLMTIVLGFGAAAVVGTDEVRASSAAGNTAVPLLALDLGGGAGSTGGTVLFAVVAAVAFATILAVVAGITLASSASVAHDLYASLKRPRRAGKPHARSHATPHPKPSAKSRAKPRGEVAVARFAAAGIGAVAIALGLLARDLNVAFLVGLAFAVAASANLPVLLYSLFWRNFTTRGAVWSVYGGLVPAVLLVVFSPVVSGSPGAMFPGVDFHVFPLQNPGLVSIPLGFLAGWIGTVLSREPADEAKHAESEVRSLTGAGAV
ncbi:cation acetate symporter [Streptomyces camponoticapitis]|uniref:Cation acetate symporter n=1 Tax=Streptomyces camponoticapitis TaxID=1616125 RepID=A0ABQ2ECF8_9ACTN|nr:cation acetate symporter [Streptomyces camponoticapitis]GGK05749.1 cation acetate symporter [Streptomyces camponoticapitis]